MAFSKPHPLRIFIKYAPDLIIVENNTADSVVHFIAIC